MFSRINIVAFSAVVMMLITGAIAWAAEAHSGKITLVDKDKVMIMNVNVGQAEEFAVDASTKVVRKGETVKLSDLAVGDRVRITAKTVGDKLVATLIDAMPSEQPKPSGPRQLR